MRSTSPILLALVVTLGGSAGAQKPPQKAGAASPRSGFFFTIGAGVGSVGVDCSVCDDDRETGVSGGLRIGAAISPHVVLALGTNGWYKREDVLGTPVTSTVGWFDVVLRVYPSRTGGFWLEIGAGGMAGSIDDTFDALTSVGPGGVFGLGYDFLVGRTVAITPYLLSAASQGNLKFNGVTILNENFNPNLVQFGLALTVN